MLKNKRRIAILIVALMLVMAFSTTGFASWLDKTVKASYRNITVFVNGVQKQALTETGTAVEPFIVDGTTYVPLRGIASMLGYQVSFNPSTYRIDLQGADIQALAAQVVQKEARIQELETLLAKYSVSDISNIEDNLNKDYKRIGTTTITDIKIKTSRKNVELQIFVDFKRNSTEESAWNKYSLQRKENVIQDMVDDILDADPDSIVSGYVQNSNNRTKLLEFSVDKRGNVVLDDLDIRTIKDLEDALNDRYSSESTREYRIYVSESSNVLELDIEAIKGTLPTSKNSRIVNYVTEICEFIVDNYDDDADIIGYVWDSKIDIRFDYYRDKLSIDWY